MTQSTGHVVMAVATGIAQDARVRKTAASVANLGYRVTLVWGDTGGSEVIPGTLGQVETIGLPVTYLLRDRAARKRARRRQWRPVLPGYRDRQRLDEAVALNSARRARRRLGRASNAIDAVASGVHNTRAYLFRAQEAVAKRALNKADRERIKRIKRRDSVDWRKELANIADLDAAFTDTLTKLRPDILHIHDIHLLGAGVTAKQRLARSGHAVPLIYDAHEYVAGMTGGNAITEAAYLAMERELVPSVDAIITVSDAIADRLTADYDPPARPAVVLNVPALGTTTASARNLRAEVGAGEATLIVYSGVLGRLRNVESVIDALPSLPGVHFAAVCVPHPDTPAARALIARAEGLGVGDRFHAVSPVTPDEIISFLASADIGVHPLVLGIPNHEMALPNKIFDYLHAGLPVAASRVALLSALIGESGIGEVFDPSSPDEIAGAIRRIAADREGYADRVRSEDMLRRFSWERQEKEIGAVYERLDGAHTGT